MAGAIQCQTLRFHALRFSGPGKVREMSRLVYGALRPDSSSVPVTILVAVARPIRYWETGIAREGAGME